MGLNADSHHPISSSARNGTLRIMLPFALILLLSPFAKAQNGSSDGSAQSYPYNNVSPSMAIVIVILIAALFLMAFFTVYIRHCADSSNSSVRTLGGVAGRSRMAARGLDPAVIETFPTLEYSEVKIHHIGKGALECAVCLSEFEDSETLRFIPKCDHVFHPECIDLWLASHTTCPVCRTNLVPQPGESIHGIPVLNAGNDIEAQNDSVEPPTEQQTADADEEKPEPQTLNRNDTRGSRSSRRPRLPRSHTTGHSLVQPGENTERFTLRLPSEVRKQILNRKLHRASSLVILPREGSSRRGYRNGEGSSRGRFSRRLDRGSKSDKWVFTMAPPFLVRASSIRSPRVANSAGEGTSADPVGPPITDSAQLPV